MMFSFLTDGRYKFLFDVLLSFSGRSKISLREKATLDSKLGGMTLLIDYQATTRVKLHFNVCLGCYLET